MTWTVARVDETHTGLFADGALIVTADTDNTMRLLRLKGRIVAKTEPDVRLTIVFRPSDPDSLTDVDVDGEAAMDEASYLAAIEAAAHRLLVFVDDYRAEKALDLQPALAL